MKPYGISRRDHDDVDVAGCVNHGRATRIYNIGERAYRSLRHGKKAAIRRIDKRIERSRAKRVIREEQSDADRFFLTSSAHPRKVHSMPTATEPVPVRLALTFKTAADAPAKVMQAVGIAQQLRLAAFRAGQECEIRIGEPAAAAGGWSGQYVCEVTAATLDRLDSEKMLRCDLGTISL